LCIEAKRLGCSLAWVDTCCIDQRRNSELDEAIRSMFRWYHITQVCILYLADTRALHAVEVDPW
ncbi:hypothetical protein BU15DRAFT_11000, partial [Melanogaster broomeanus]